MSVIWLAAEVVYPSKHFRNLLSKTVLCKNSQRFVEWWASSVYTHFHCECWWSDFLQWWCSPSGTERCPRMQRRGTGTTCRTVRYKRRTACCTWLKHGRNKNNVLLRKKKYFVWFPTSALKQLKQLLSNVRIWGHDKMSPFTRTV